MISDITPHRGQARYRDHVFNDDAITLLVAEHGEVRDMFAEYHQLLGERSGRQRVRLVRQICLALVAHTAVEEEVLYPALSDVLGDQDAVAQAERVHAQARALIEQLQAMDPSDDLYDPTVQLLQAAIEHHMQEEEGDLFPRLRRTGLDLEALGRDMALRKDEVFVELDDTDRYSYS